MNAEKYARINATRDAIEKSNDIIFNAIWRNVAKVDSESIIINGQRIDATQDVLRNLHLQCLAAIQEPMAEEELNFD